MFEKDVIILGPCAMDSRELYLETGKYLFDLMTKLGLQDSFLYKSSFDKANRSSIRGGRGINNLREAILCFAEMKELCPGIKLTTDIHESHQALPLSPFIDVIQIPAFLCRQTDLLVACAQRFPVVNIKKMQHLGPNNMNVGIDKIKEANPSCVAWLTDRGTNLGYSHLVSDFAMTKFYKEVWDKVILDCTHSTQRSRKMFPEGLQGDPELAKSHFLAAAIYGFDGVFAEVHPDRKNSTSDGDCMIDLSDVEKLLKKREVFKKVEEYKVVKIEKDDGPTF